MSRLRKERRDKRRQEEANRHWEFLIACLGVAVLPSLLAFSLADQVADAGLHRHEGRISEVRQSGWRRSRPHYIADVGVAEPISFAIAHWLSEPGLSIKVGDQVDILIFDGLLGSKTVELWVNGDRSYSLQEYREQERFWILVLGGCSLACILLAAIQIARGYRQGLTLSSSLQHILKRH